MKVMIVEDEKDSRDVLKQILNEQGFDTVALETGLDLFKNLRVHKPDLLLLDQLLPGRSGVELIKDLRATNEYRRLPVIVVTGLAAEQDKVNAFNLGADDYVTKPFFPGELAARIKALSRRSDFAGDQLQPNIACDNLLLDFSAYRVTLDGKEVPLTLTEFKILSELLKDKGQVLSREKLRDRALGSLTVTDRTIDVHMASLRKKLGAMGPRIETVRGVGYRFV
jgi:DNA-binding response OmpR family regulator